MSMLCRSLRFGLNGIFRTVPLTCLDPPPRAGVDFCGLRPTEKDPLGVSGSEKQFWKKKTCPQNNLQWLNWLNLLTKEFVGFFELKISSSQFGSFPPNRSFNRLRFSPIVRLRGCWAVLSKKSTKHVYTDIFMSYTYIYTYYIHTFGLVAQPLLKPSKKTFPTQAPKKMVHQCLSTAVLLSPWSWFDKGFPQKSSTISWGHSPSKAPKQNLRDGWILSQKWHKIQTSLQLLHPTEVLLNQPFSFVK